MIVKAMYVRYQLGILIVMLIVLSLEGYFDAPHWMQPATLVGGVVAWFILRHAFNPLVEEERRSFDELGD